MRGSFFGIRRTVSKKMNQLSKKAIHDLRVSLCKKYGESFILPMSDEELNQIGILILTSVSESLKLRIKSQKSVII